MGSIINVENLTKSFTGRKLFCEASFSVQEGEKVGIVGINGTGKSTLLRILAKEEEADEGTLTFMNKTVLNFLPQNPTFDNSKSVIENVMEKTILSDLDEQNQFQMESDAKAFLTKLGIVDFEQKIEELSGGQKKKVALAIALLRPCDVLLLDEPTNHLDYDMIEWLEKYLRDFKKTLVMVTHDRYFLDGVCNRIVEIDKGNIYSYQANYSGFLELKLQREDSLRASERKRQSILRNEIEWMKRGARARSTKQKAHIKRYEDLRAQKGPQTDEKLSISSTNTRMGRTTIELKSICKAYGSQVLISEYSYIFLKNDRIGYVGNNGCGKTTLMKMIAGIIKPDSGTIEIGQTIKLGYYSQEVHETNPKQRVIDYIKDTAEYVRTRDGLVSASAMLERFLFEPEQQYNLIEKLSGGERRRLYLLKVLMEAPNVLILDEPTNDLDTQTLAILEDYLDSYEGIVITVSHDRYFLDRIVGRIFAFEENGKLVQYEGGYTDYLSKRPEFISRELKKSEKENVITEAVNEKADARSTWTHEKKIKFTYAEAKEYETIEADIEKLEKQLEALDQEMIKNASNYGKLNALSNEKEEVKSKLNAKLERWEYLEELALKIGLN